MSQAMDFIVQWFGASEAPVFLSSLPNEKNDPNEPAERFIATRDRADVEAFIEKWDRPARGLFMCVSTVKAGFKRNKDNVSEICGLWADVDFKDVADNEKTIRKRVLALRYAPAIIVSSGNGLHLYWPFKEVLTINIIDGAEIIERVEENLKLLADLCGADMRLTQVVALMRVPGTHNSKRGEWKDVTVEIISENRYELDDLEEMLTETSPVVLRNLRPAPTPGEVNPFEEYAAAAAAIGYKPPLDVQNSLEQMLYMGGEETSVHGTQVRVTASMLSSGRDVDEVVSLVLKATQSAAGDYGKRWNWKREEKTIRGMCATWLKKHPQDNTGAPVKEKTTPKIVGGTDTAANAATVHKIDERKAKPKTQAQIQAVIDKANIHIAIGTALIKAWQDRGTPIMIVVDQLWRYSDGMWCAPESKGRQTIDAEIEMMARAMKQISTLKLVAEVRGWIFRNPDIFHDDIEWDDHGKIAIRHGLIDPITLAFEPAQSSHHVTTRIDCDFDAAATCPVWLEMLRATFDDRNDLERGSTIALIQEVLGAALIEEKSKALSRALVFFGISNTGKTDLIKTISGLLTDYPIATPLAALDGAHGLMEFQRNAPWVLHEAFDSQKWHFSATVKSILSGDPVQINIKNGALVTRRIRQPIFWGTNIPPQFKEATRAIINRMIVVSCFTVFDPKAPVGVAIKAREAHYSEPSDLILATEKPGLLNWALAGLRRALDRGRFDTTAAMDETLEAVRTDSNIVAGFLDDCADFEPGYMISTSDFCAAFSVWWNETKGEDRHTPSNDSIGRALVAFGDPRVGIDVKALRNNKHRFYAGVHLNTVGLDYWAGAASEGLAKGKTARLASQQGDVNRHIPPSWETLPVIIKLRKNVVTRDVSPQNGEVSGVTPVRDRSPKF